MSPMGGSSSSIIFARLSTTSVAQLKGFAAFPTRSVSPDITLLSEIMLLFVRIALNFVSGIVFLFLIGFGTQGRLVAWSLDY